MKNPRPFTAKIRVPAASIGEVIASHWTLDPDDLPGEAAEIDAAIEKARREAETALLRRVRRETAEAVLCHLARVYEDAMTDDPAGAEWRLVQEVRSAVVDVPGLLRRLGLEDRA